MTSRLDRLFILLESGSSAVTRRAAAKQIGEVQKLHPHELHYLLNRLIGYLHSSTWDTRIAASQAIEAILSNVPEWKPNGNEQNSKRDASSLVKSEFLSFEDFNFINVLQKGARLMGSEGTEFDLHEDPNSSDQIKQQRALLNERLGLTQANKLGLNFMEMINDDDMRSSFRSSTQINDQKVPVQDILKINAISNSQVSHSEQSLSCREINRAKRKARQTGTGSGSGVNRTNSTNEEPEKKKQKVETEKFEVFYDCNEPTPDGTGSWGDTTTTWPFNQFCLRLCLDLFNSKWEIRHGAATALRELINCHSSGGGTTIYMTEEEIKLNHYSWLEDIALRLLCVLSLDRFGDFISDQVVAPVRETSAQVLGIVLKEMPPEKVTQIVQVLLNLLKQNEWEVRHGGLLGLKYIFVVREDLLQKFLPSTIADILIGLFDPVDDVGAVAATTLIPVATWLPKLLNESQVSSIVKMLWDLLLEQDELTSACSSFMGLLAAILCLPNAAQWIQMEPMCILIPRLWPFLSHSSSSVRRSTLQTMKTLTENNAPHHISHVDFTNNILKNSIKNIDLDSKNLKLNFGVIDWNSTLLQEALRHVFQRVLVEPISEIQDLGKSVWQNLIQNADLTALLHAACPYVSSWICLAMQPPRLAFDQSILLYAKSNLGSEKRRPRMDDDLGGSSGLQQKLYLGGNESTPQDIREKNFMKARINAAEMLGALSHYLVLPAPGVVYTPNIESPIDCYTKVLMGHLQSRSAVQRLVCGLLISFWSLSDTSIRPGPPILQEKLRSCIMEYVYYEEVSGAFTRLLQEGHDFLATLKQYKVQIKDFENSKILTLDQIHALTTTATENLKVNYNLKPKISDVLEERRRGLQNFFTQTNLEQYCYNISTQAALAGAIVCLQCLPDKLNPIIKPLMESIKREPCELLQQLTAQYLVELLDQVGERTPCPNSKVFTNLCALLKSDHDYTPKIQIPQTTMKELNLDDNTPNGYYGILTLANQQKANGCINGTYPSTSRGRPPNTTDLNIDETLISEDPTTKQNRIQRIGATYAITTICKHYGPNLYKKFPVLLKIMINDIENMLESSPPMESIAAEIINEEKANDLVTSLQLAEVAVPYIDISLQEITFKLLPLFGVLITHPLKVIRHMVARGIATLATVDHCVVMKFVVETILPLFEKTERVICRQGAAETIERIVEKLQFKMVPYVVLLVVPLLGRMSDTDEFVRLMSTHCFATLIQLMPLDSKSNTVIIASKELQERKTRDREFLDHLFAPKTIPDYKVPVSIGAELRTYQQAGINWLWFLNKYNLHGILCDDMGLGKTLQTICILAGDHHHRIFNKQSALPSIVICPPTLTGHWVYEVEKFLPSKFLRPLHYVGLPIGREKLRAKIGKCNLVVVSYDTVRKDIDFFNSVHWNYCVLDEGHIIKNGKTKSSKAIKQLKANHRLILSGTPIQNNVLELWSLFDFLMPGFLGTEKQFSQKFSRPILASRDPKSSSKEQEAGVLAMEALHRQILPFLLRRVKEDVLTDLPPKITQDLLCELSPLQERLYEDFSKTHLNSEIKDCIENLGETESLNKKTHIFQALRYLQNVCNHPKLVLSQNHPEYTKISQELGHKNSSLNDIDHSAKLPALKQLLLDCGIGVDTEIVNQHRALIFCQLKAMLDIVENDLLRKHLPAVSYLRLDGSIPASNRHEIVTKFNEDPSIDVLLLTTQVGGLGLNLTGADTVIFVEHDWNPMKDLQAMDRAHRIGQKKVVNVYRLITRKSLEEKIMGLQKFKILTANTVVSAENASMETMGTDQLLDLFNLSDEEKVLKKQSGSSTKKAAVSMKNVMENLPELWDDKQYEEEYDLTSFVQGLKK